MEIELLKMNGLGNDFLIYDARNSTASDLSIELIKHLSDRQNAKTNGCDQFIIIENSSKAAAKMLIFNADGSEVDACGNATRCVGWILADESLDLKSNYEIETGAGILKSSLVAPNRVRVDMGEPKTDWKSIPLAKEIIDTANLPITTADFKNPAGVSMGNPHMVFFTNIDIDTIDIAKVGAPLEKHDLYPARANVEFVNVMDSNNVKMRVFERGVGETLACGTGACAVAVAANIRGLCARNVNVAMKGGVLNIEWSDKNNHVFMTGDVESNGKLVIATNL